MSNRYRGRLTFACAACFSSKMPPEPPGFAARAPVLPGCSSGERSGPLHEGHYLHRRPAAACPPQGSARLFRVRRQRLLQRGNAARQPRRPRGHQVAPARAGGRLLAQPRHHRHRAEGVVAVRAGADRAVRHAARRRRDPVGARRQRGRHSVHALHHVDLLDRGRGGGDAQAVLVPALRHPGPQLLQGHPRRARRRRNATRWCSRWICRCSASATATSRTA